MYCTSCGSQNPEGAKFCCKCGSQIVELSGRTDDRSTDSLPASTPRNPSAAATVNVTIPAKTMPTRSARTAYIWLGIEVVSASVLVALALFWLARMIASGNPELESHLTGSGGIIVGLFAVSIGLSRSWKRLQISEPDSEPNFRKKHRRFSQFAVGFAAFCAVAAIAAGASQGSCDATVSAFTADVKQSQELMQAIGNARSETTNATIEDYIQMYELIEPKVVQGRALVSRLRAEIPRCGDFKSRAGRFELIINNLDQRLALLTQEIEVARSIDSLPAAERESKWQSQLVPLIDKETSLERELQTLRNQ